MKVSAYILMLYYLKCPTHFLLWSHETNAVSIKAESRPNPQQWEQQQEKYTCLHDVWKNLYVQNLVQPVSVPGTEEAGNELTRITWSHRTIRNVLCGCIMWKWFYMLEWWRHILYLTHWSKWSSQVIYFALCWFLWLHVVWCDDDQSIYIHTYA